MENFFDFPRNLMIFFPLKLIIGDSARPHRSKLIIFTFQCVSFVMITTLMGFLMCVSIQDVDKFMGSFMVFSVMSTVSLKYLMLFIKRESVQMALKSLKTREKFDQSLQIYFNRFQKFQQVLLSFSLLTITISILGGFGNAIRGNQVFLALIKFPFKISNKFLFILVMFEMHLIQCTGLLLNFFVIVIPCKLIFVTAMEFKQLGRDFLNLKIRESKIEPVPMTSIEIYKNLTKKFPTKVKKLMNLLIKL